MNATRRTLLTIGFTLACTAAFAADSPFTVQVYQLNASNLVFVVSNASNASIRLPTTNYVKSDFYQPVYSNDWQHVKSAYIGLWLAEGWRYRGTNWSMNMSHQERLAKLAPIEIKPGHSIRVTRELDVFDASLVASNTTAKSFGLEVSDESANLYGLTSGYARTTNLIQSLPGQPNNDKTSR